MKIKILQEGGQMQAEPAAPEAAAPAQQGAPAEAGSPEEVLMQIAQTAMMALQNQDCEAAMAVCQAFVQMIQEQQGGATETPQEPVYRAGGKLVRRISE